MILAPTICRSLLKSVNGNVVVIEEGEPTTVLSEFFQTVVWHVATEFPTSDTLSPISQKIPQIIAEEL
jgi:hypothetical protein